MVKMKLWFSFTRGFDFRLKIFSKIVDWQNYLKIKIVSLNFKVCPALEKAKVASPLGPNRRLRHNNQVKPLFITSNYQLFFMALAGTTTYLGKP